MNTNSVKNQLFMFLRSFGIIEEFMSNFSKDTKFQTIMELCGSVGRNDVMRYSFIWKNTKQGEKFWRRYHNLWVGMNPKKFCDKPEDYLVTYPIGSIIDVDGIGQVQVTEGKVGSCQGCAFRKKNTNCLNRQMYACTPLTRGDNVNVVFTKIC